LYSEKQSVRHRLLVTENIKHPITFDRDS
jgi:hypothetical protein